MSRIFFRVNSQTETVDALEYPQRRFLVSMRHDYLIKPVSTLKRREVGETIASASVWRRGAEMFSNKVNLMETLISWVVCRIFILLLWYSIVGLTIILWSCVGYHVREARYDHRVYSRVSRVQFFDILLCKSAIRRLFFPSCSMAVFCTLSRLFVPFGDSGFSLLGVRLAVHVHFAFVVWAGTLACCRAALKWGIRNRKETENQNPESINQRKQVLQIRENLLRRIFQCQCFCLLKNKRTSKKVLKQKLPVCWNLCNREGYYYENRNKVPRKWFQAP